MNRTDGLRIAREVKALLLDRGYPVKRVVLFGSVAKGIGRPESDIDIAVITDPFKDSRMEERVDIHLASMNIDMRVETVTLYPNDLEAPFFTLGHEIEKTGVDV